MKYSLLLTAIIVSISLSSFAQTKGKTTYRIVVSFQSECCGVPSDSTIRSFVKTFKKQYRIKKITAYHIGPMGREGEYYLAFKLNELTRKQAANFIAKLKKIKKSGSDPGMLSFREAFEITAEEIPQRATTEKISL